MFQLTLTSSLFVLEQLEGFPPHRKIPNNLLDCSIGMTFSSEICYVITLV